MAETGGTVAHRAVAHEIDGGLVLVGRPVALEVIEKGRPVGRQAVGLEIPQWKGEPVVDTDQCRPVFGEPLDQPFGDSAPRPVFARARRWWNLDGWRCLVREVDAQSLQARCGGPRP